MFAAKVDAGIFLTNKWFVKKNFNALLDRDWLTIVNQTTMDDTDIDTDNDLVLTDKDLQIYDHVCVADCVRCYVQAYDLTLNH